MTLKKSLLPAALATFTLDIGAVAVIAPLPTATASGEDACREAIAVRTGGEDRGAVQGAVAEDPVEVELVGEQVGVDPTGGGTPQSPVEGGEHPPHRPAFGNRCHDGLGGLEARAHGGELGEGEVGPLELAGGGQDVGGELGHGPLGHVHHREHLEAAERSAEPLGLGEGRQRVAPGDEQGTDVTSLDLVHQGGARHLSQHPGQLGATARGPRGRGAVGRR